MDAARFEAIVAAYGADVRRWPEAERQAAEWFARTQPEAAALCAEARALDSALDADIDASPADLRLTRRLMASFPRPIPVLRVAAALAACAVIGLTFGYMRAQTLSGDEADAALSAAFGEGLDV
ncbi:MAG TPA: hypothetical protein VG841_00360 [Caulobacterales bacterium]|nr:hypothetical protein [Caulobacterales bacterium]